MQDNPYSTIIQIMRKEGAAYNTPGLMLATVVAPPPNLFIKVGEIQVGKASLLVADDLLPGYKRNISIAAAEPVSGQMTFLDTLAPGDLLAVMPTYDGQTFIVLARVVRLE